MKIANFSVKRPVTITIVVAVLMILGLFTFSKMPVDLLRNGYTRSFSND